MFCGWLGISSSPGVVTTAVITKSQKVNYYLGLVILFDVATERMKKGRKITNRGSTCLQNRQRRPTI